MTRILLWEGLAAGAPEAKAGDGDEPPELADLRQRQARGEIGSDLDPAYVLLALMGAVITPTAMPQRVQELCGLPADSDEFRTRYGEQLRRIAERLAGPVPESEPVEASDRRRR